MPRSSRGDNHNQLGADLSKYLVVQPGDLVFNKLRTWQGGLGASKYLGIVSPAYFVCRPCQDYDARFLHYLLRSPPYLQELTRISKWMPPAQFDIGWDQLRLLPVIAPPSGTQKQIADYLDAETARIDALIANKRRIAEVLKERLRLVAFESTRADSELVALRRFVSEVKTGTTPRAEELEVFLGGDVPWYSPGDVGDWLELHPPTRTLAREAVTTRAVPLFPAGSALVVGIGASAGKVAFLSHEASGNQQMTAVVPRPDVLARFLVWELLAMEDEDRQTAPFATLPIINNDFLKSLPVAVPRLSQQEAVVSKLDTALRITASLTKLLGEQILRLREHRQALITAAVTGQCPAPGIAA